MAARESKLQSRCIGYLTDESIAYVNIHGGGWSAKGAPDILACINGRFVAFELKVGENGMQSDQRIWRKRILSSGGQHFCPRSLQEFISIIQSIKEETRGTTDDITR